MIKRLRKRVIALSMIAVFIVLLILMSAINVVNYVSNDKAIDEVLELLKENGGRFPGMGHQKPGLYVAGGMGNGAGGDPEDQDDREDLDDEFIFGLRPGMTEETPYETRYFTVILNKDEEVAYIDMNRIAAVSDEDALAMTKEAAKSGKESAYVRRSDTTYKYVATDCEDIEIKKIYIDESFQGFGTVWLGDVDEDCTMYIFVDCTRNINSVKRFLTTSLLVSLIGLAGIAALVVALSSKMIKPIVDNYEKQKTFITNASHELKTPLAVISSCNEVAELEGGRTKWTEAISEQVERMNDLTGKMVALAKQDEKLDQGLEIKEEIDFTDLVETALEPFITLAESKGLTMKVKADPALKVKGDRSSLTELINVIADNSIKYCGDGGEIKFNLAKQSSKVVLTQENPAEGLVPGAQKEIFDRFHRGDSSHNQEEVSGYGIGLSLAEAIVEAHGGKISANSPDGNSFVLTVTI